jgi:hypothetical protein
VPTSPELIDIESVDSLVEKWFEQCRQLVEIGIDENIVFEQTLITPSCGTGTLSEPQAMKVLGLTKEVSEKIRESYLNR